MNFLRPSLLRVALATLGLGHVLPAPAAPAEWEENVWPLVVRQAQAAERRVESFSAAGPLLFRRPSADASGSTAHGFRPFWVQFDSPAGSFRSGHFLYPLFNYSLSDDGTAYRWSVLELVRRWGRPAGAPPPATAFDGRDELEIFPFWFSRETADPADAYRALFPLHGTIRNKLFLERLSWTLFPLHAQSERRGGVTTFAPWPIVRLHSGATRGWGIWPLYQRFERPGVSAETHWLWPLGYHVVRAPQPDDPAGTPAREDFGVLPLYARSTGPGFASADFVWPFFGWTERTAAPAYRERRYFWPFLVQGRGDRRHVNRFAPFYTHSVVAGVDKRWFLWPLVRHAAWRDEGLIRERTQVLYFLYWRESQRRADRPAAPAATLTHLWPLASVWDNGAGRRQWQALSPLDVFFGGNDKVRQAWSPLFALARHERRAPGDSRTALLWNAVTWEERAADRHREFHLGPLLGVVAGPTGKRVTVGRGLFGFERGAAGGWRPFWGRFPARTAAAPAPAAGSPSPPR